MHLQVNINRNREITDHHLTRQNPVDPNRTFAVRKIVPFRTDLLPSVQIPDTIKKREHLPDHDYELGLRRETAFRSLRGGASGQKRIFHDPSTGLIEYK
jgi:hypothetical protein